jgi:DnaK suppressor protein
LTRPATARDQGPVESAHVLNVLTSLVRDIVRRYKPPKIWVRETHMSSDVLEADYKPSDNEPFMNERQVAYFRLKLQQWKEDIIRESKETLSHLQDENHVLPDIADRASSETDRSLELRTRDRQRKLISKIDAALKRIDDGSYGYCEETGDPISLRRLDARPIATLSIEAQERHEKRERVYRDD